MGDPLYWQNSTSNLDGSTPSNAADIGALITAGAAGVDGATVTLIAALSHAVHYVEIIAGGWNANTEDTTTLLDILINTGGGDTVLISDIAVGGSQYTTTTGHPVKYEFPIAIPSGAAIKARARTSRATTLDGRVVIRASGDPTGGSGGAYWVADAVETLGIIGNTGTPVTAGNAGAWGAWTNVGSVSSVRYGAIVLAFQGDDTMSTAGYHFQIGTASAPIPGCPLLFGNTTSGEVIVAPGMMGLVVPCDIPAGTQLQVRATQNASAADPPKCILYGLKWNDWVSLGGGGGGDVTPPTEDPAVGPDPSTPPGGSGFPTDYATAATTPIVVDITDAGGLALIVVEASFSSALGPWVGVFKRGAFQLGWQLHSTVTAITNGFRLSIRPDEGWPPSVDGATANVFLDLIPVDNGGNVS